MSVHGDVAQRRAADREQLLVGQCIQCEQQGGSSDRGYELGRVLQQLAAHRIRNDDVRARVASAAGRQQKCREKEGRTEMDSTHGS